MESLATSNDRGVQDASYGRARQQQTKHQARKSTGRAHQRLARHHVGSNLCGLCAVGAAHDGFHTIPIYGQPRTHGAFGVEDDVGGVMKEPAASRRATGRAEAASRRAGRMLWKGGRRFPASTSAGSARVRSHRSRRLVKPAAGGAGAAAVVPWVAVARGYGSSLLRGFVGSAWRFADDDVVSGDSGSESSAGLGNFVRGTHGSSAQVPARTSVGTCLCPLVGKTE